MEIPQVLRERFDTAKENLLAKLREEKTTATDPFFAPRARIYPCSEKYGEGIDIAATGHFLTRAAMMGMSYPATIEGFLDVYGVNNVAIARAWIQYCQDLPREKVRPNLWEYLLSEWPEENVRAILEEGITFMERAKILKQPAQEESKRT